jgi:hypothetical protein
MYDAAMAQQIFSRDYWNNSTRIIRANCYAHAMNVLVEKIGGWYHKLQPGEIRDQPIKAGMKIRTADALIAAMAIVDITTAGINFNGITNIAECKEAGIGGHSQYKVALVTGSRIGSDLFFDYHWYKENHDRTWSHKPGGCPAVAVDASDAEINAENTPEKCNRAYSRLNYSFFLGYYMVTHT